MTKQTSDKKKTAAKPAAKTARKSAARPPASRRGKPAASAGKPSPGRSAKKKPYRRIAGYVAAALLAAVLALAGLTGGRRLIDSKLPAFAKGGEIYIEKGTTVGSVLAQIEEMQPLHPKSLQRCIEAECTDENLRPGLYKFNPTHTAVYVARAITRGWQTPVRLVLSGPVRTKAEIASKISSQMMVDSLTCLKALNDSILLAKYGTTPSHVFEIILPDTYEVYWDWDMDKILNRLKKEHDLFWTKERTAKAKAMGLTPQQVSVLASIVAQESHRPDEYPKIASVYLTRLSRGMKLQACPTVCYIYDYKIKRVLLNHLKNPSPYNTYIHPGLPPAPICVPEKVHIEAVLNPDPRQYLYFCADSSFNGRNVFAETYAEHLENARRYHAAMDERKAQKEMRSMEAVLPE